MVERCARCAGWRMLVRGAWWLVLASVGSAGRRWMRCGMTEPMAPERLAEIDARLDAATPGPWETDTHCYWIRTPVPIDVDESDWGPEGHTAYRLATDADDHAWRYADVAFIAHAPQDIADLRAEVDRLTTERDEWRQADAESLALSARYRERALKAEDELDRLQGQVTAIEDLFAGGPDASCRTKWSDGA